MRVMRKLLLGAVMALAAMALMAPSAFGQIEVKTEPNPGAHCGVVTPSGHSPGPTGCVIHAVSTQDIILKTHAHPSTEPVLSICRNEFEARVGETGAGQIYNQFLSDPPDKPGACAIEACRETNTQEKDGVGKNLAHGDNELWSFQIKKVGGSRVLEVTFCVQGKTPNETEGVPCTLHIPITSLGHTYTFNASPEVGCETPGDEREVDGRWTIENAGEAGHTNIEIVG